MRILFFSILIMIVMPSYAMTVYEPSNYQAQSVTNTRFDNSGKITHIDTNAEYININGTRYLLTASSDTTLEKGMLVHFNTESDTGESTPRITKIWTEDE